MVMDQLSTGIATPASPFMVRSPIVESHWNCDRPFKLGETSSEDGAKVGSTPQNAISSKDS